MQTVKKNKNRFLIGIFHIIFFSSELKNILVCNNKIMLNNLLLGVLPAQADTIFFFFFKFPFIHNQGGTTDEPLTKKPQQTAPSKTPTLQKNYAKLQEHINDPE